MKKVVALFQIVTLIVLAVFANCDEVEANQYAEIYGEDIIGKQGDEITVPIMISGNGGIMGFQINIAYDEKCLSPVNVTSKSLSNGVLDYNIKEKDSSDIDVLWSGTEEISDDGVLFDVVFKVSEYANNGTTKIDISYLQEDTFDGSYHDVKLSCNSFNITIDGEPMETESPTPTSVPTASSKELYTVLADAPEEIEAGQSISVPVKIENNLGIMGFLMFVKYDADLLEPISVEKGEVIPEGTTFDDNCTIAVGDSFKILWSGVDEIDTDGLLFTLNFKVKEEAEDTDSVIELSYKQTDTFDGDYQDVKFQCKPIVIHIIGKSTIDPTATPPETTPPVTEEPTITPPETTPPVTEEPTITPPETTPPVTEEPTITPPETQTPTKSPNQQQGTVNPTSAPNKSEKEIENDIKTVFPKLERVKIKKVKAKGKRKIEVKWKKEKNIQGYQLQYAANKKFKKKKSKNLKASKGSITLTRLKPKKKYYVRIRSYTYYEGKKMYGRWSKVKKCKVK